MISDEFVAHTDRGSTGTKMPRTNWRDMAAYKIAAPPAEIAKSFASTARNVTDRIRTNNAESRTLAALRDALLPKLISGELRVPDAERIAGRCA